LEKQLIVLVDLVRNYLEAGEAQSNTYEKVQTNLVTANTTEQIQAIVQILLANSSKAQRDAEDLRARLKSAQTETVEMQQRLVKAEKLASLDGLTSLPNRRAFEEFLNVAVTRSHADGTPLSLVMADLDHFKRINDKYGHPTGDAVIKTFAKILSENVRSTDMVARYGGEEFAIVLPRTPLGNASFVVERIRNLTSSTDWVDPSNGRSIDGITASFGIAEIVDGEAPQGIVKRADKKLYLAKQNGRNRAELDSALGG
jgi:diguanylate cyclase